MTAALGFVLGVAFVVLCVGFVVAINNAAQWVSDQADKKAAARDAASTFCRDFVPDSSEVQATLAKLPTMGPR